MISSVRHNDIPENCHLTLGRICYEWYSLGDLLLLYWQSHNESSQRQIGDFRYGENGAKNLAKTGCLTYPKFA